MRNLLCVAAVLSMQVCVAQQTPQPAEGARELFFVGTAPKDALPAIRSSKAATPAAAPAPASTGALHLGLRYTLLLVPVPGEAGQPTDPYHNFHKGDCVAVSLEANRSGYLYVLAKESNGDWIPLFPTPELSDQSNKIDPGQVIRTPKQTCFELEDPPGSETLFVVLSRNPQDIGELVDSIKAPGAKTNAAVNQVTKDFGTREMPFREVVKQAPRSSTRREPEHAVYVVTGSDKPANTLVTRVEIHHQ